VRFSQRTDACAGLGEEVLHDSLLGRKPGGTAVGGHGQQVVNRWADGRRRTAEKGVTARSEKKGGVQVALADRVEHGVEGQRRRRLMWQREWQQRWNRNGEGNETLFTVFHGLGRERARNQRLDAVNDESTGRSGKARSRSRVAIKAEITKGGAINGSGAAGADTGHRKDGALERLGHRVDESTKSVGDVDRSYWRHGVTGAGEAGERADGGLTTPRDIAKNRKDLVPGIGDWLTRVDHRRRRERDDRGEKAGGKR
jgi:hypothetical protein